MRSLIAALVLPLAACAAPDEPPPNSNRIDPANSAAHAGASGETFPAPSSGGEPMAAVETLEGHWRLGGLDGGDLTGIALTGTGSTLYWEPTCAGFSLDYRIEGNTIAFTGERPGIVCRIGYPRELEAIFAALRAAKTIERTASNGIRLAGGGHSVTLYSQ